MTIHMIIFLAIVFIITIGISCIIIRLLMPSTTQTRLEKIAAENEEIKAKELGQWDQKIDKLYAPLASISLPSEGWENSTTRIQFMHAGYRAQTIPLFYFAAKTILALVFAGIFFLFINITGMDIEKNNILLFSLLLTSLGFYLPNIILSRLVFVRQRDLFENFPDAIDLMTVCVEAGLGLDAAMSKVGEEMRLKCQPLAEELHLVNLEMRAGRTREMALRNLALRTGVEEIEGLVNMLVQADKFGTSIAASLRVHSDMLRTKRRLRAEEAAAKIALKLLFPLVFFIFPSIFLVLVGPALIQIYRQLIPAMAGM